MIQLLRLTLILAIAAFTPGCFATYWASKLTSPTIELSQDSGRSGVEVELAFPGHGTQRVAIPESSAGAPLRVVPGHERGPGCGMDEIPYTPPITELDEPPRGFLVEARAAEGEWTVVAEVDPIARERWVGSRVLGWSLLPFALVLDTAASPLELLVWLLSWTWR